MRLLPILLLLVMVVVLLLPLVGRIRLSVPRARPTLPDELVKDPVCQTYIVKSRAIRRTDAGGIRYFCSEQCARLDTGA
jgi:hypothetical protein